MPGFFMCVLSPFTVVELCNAVTSPDSLFVHPRPPTELPRPPVPSAFNRKWPPGFWFML